MKKVVLILVAVFSFGIIANAQDVIILKNGDEIKSIVQEVGIEYVKYKKFDNQTGPTYNVAIAQIFMIKYQNGTKDLFNDIEKTVETISEQPKPTYQEEVTKPVEKKDVSISESTNVESNDNSEANTDFVLQKKSKIMINTFVLTKGQSKTLCRQ